MSVHQAPCDDDAVDGDSFAVDIPVLVRVRVLVLLLPRSPMPLTSAVAVRQREERCSTRASLVSRASVVIHVTGLTTDGYLICGQVMHTPLPLPLPIPILGFYSTSTSTNVLLDTSALLYVCALEET